MLNEKMFDLCGGVFEDHGNDSNRSEHYVIKFDNGYALSIVAGAWLYSGNNTYEVAVLKKDDEGHYSVNYEPEFVEGDVLGYQTVEEIQEHIKALSVFGDKIIS